MIRHHVLAYVYIYIELDNDVLVTTCYYYTVEDVLLLASLARDKT